MPTILIVDDSRFMRQWLKKLLQQKSTCKITEAKNGHEAVEIYKKTRPDLVLMDIVMQNSSGLDALKEIIAFDAYAKVIMCSSMGTKQHVLEALEIGAKDFVVKPFFDGLHERIKKQLDTTHLG